MATRRTKEGISSTHTSAKETAAKGLRFKVQGQLRSQSGKPLQGVTVRALIKTLQWERQAGSGVADAQGSYSFTYPVPTELKDGVDLVVRVIDLAGSEIAVSPVRINAQPEETLDLTISGDFRCVSEYERLTSLLAPVIGSTALAQVSDEDVPYLAAKTGAEQEQIRTLIKSAKLSQETGLPEQLVYGVTRQQHTADLSTIKAQTGEGLHRLLQTAYAGNIIPKPNLSRAELGRRLDDVILKEGEGSLAKVVEKILPKGEKRRAFLLAQVRHQGTAETFLQTHDLKKYAETSQQAADLHFVLKSADLGGSNATVLTRLLKQRQAGKIATYRDLAAYQHKDWLALVQKAPGIERPEEEARRMAAAVEAEFPTDVLAHAVIASKESPELATFFTNYLGTDRSFDIGATLISDFLKKNPKLVKGIPQGRRQSLVLQLQSLQRLRRVSSNQAQTRHLAAKGIESASQINRYGRNAFIHQFSDIDGGAAAAARIYDTSKSVAALSQALLAEYHPAFNKIGLATLRSNSKAVRNIMIPDWQDLFGAFDNCDPDESRSVLSPAAYLTDILHFLNDRKAVTVSALTVLLARRPDLAEIELDKPNAMTPVPFIDLVNELLEAAVAPLQFQLATWGSLLNELNQRNLSARLRQSFALQGYTLSPEALLLEPVSGSEWRITDKGWHYRLAGAPAGSSAITVSPWPQTGGTASELGALPEHVNAGAYAKLRNEVYPWNLPLDLWLEEVRANLDQLSVTRHTLMRTFVKDASASMVALAAEYLRISGVEWDAITGNARLGRKPYEFWGFTGKEQNIYSWYQDVRALPTLLDRSGLQYRQLVELLRLRYLNPLFTPYIFIDVNDTTKWEADFYKNPSLLATCDISRLCIPYLNESPLARIHSCVRLWRKLRWSMAEVDQAICALITVSIDNELLSQLQQLELALKSLFQLQLSDSGGFLLAAQRTANEIESWLGTQQEVILDAVPAQFSSLDHFLEELLHQELEIEPADADDLHKQGRELKKIATGLQGLALVDPAPWRQLLSDLNQKVAALQAQGGRDKDLMRRLNHVARDPGKNLTVKYLEKLLDELAAIDPLMNQVIAAATGAQRTALEAVQADLVKFRKLTSALGESMFWNEVLRLLETLLQTLDNGGDPWTALVPLSAGLQVQQLEPEVAAGRKHFPDPHETAGNLQAVLQKLMTCFDRILRSNGASYDFFQLLAQLSRSLSSLPAQRATVAALAEVGTALRQVSISYADPDSTTGKDGGAIVRLMPLVYQVAAQCSVYFARQGLDLDFYVDALLVRTLSQDLGDQDFAAALPARLAVHLRRLSLFRQREVRDPVYLERLLPVLDQAAGLGRKLDELLAGLGLDQGILVELAELYDIVRRQIKKGVGTIPLATAVNYLRLLDPLSERVDAACQVATGYVLNRMREVNAGLVDLRNKLYAALPDSSLTSDLLVQVAHIQELRARFKLPIPVLLSWYAPLDTYRYGDDDNKTSLSLFERVFQGPALRKSNPGRADLFELDLIRTELKRLDQQVSDPSVNAALTAAMGVTAAELDLMTIGRAAHVGGQDVTILPPVAAPGRGLTVEKLSQLYRHTILARALKLSINDLLRIKGLTGLDPFHAEGFATAATLEFIKIVEKIRGSGFTLDELEYLLRNLPLSSAAAPPTVEAMAALLEKLRAGLRQIGADTAPVPDSRGEATRRYLASTYPAEAVDQAVLWLGWDRRRLDQALAEQSDATFQVPLDPAVAPDFSTLTGALKDAVSFSKTEMRVGFRGVMTLDQKKALLQLSSETAYLEAVNALFDAPRALARERLQQMGAPVASALLPSLPAGVAWPDTLKHRVSYDVGAGNLLVVGALSKQDMALLQGASPASAAGDALRAAINELYREPRLFVVANLRAFLMPTLKWHLSNLPAAVAFPQDFQERIYFDPAKAELCLVGLLSERDKARLLVLSDAEIAALPAGDQSCYKEYAQALDRILQMSQDFIATIADAGSFVPDPGNEFLTVDDGAVIFDEETTSAARFALVLGKYLAHEREVQSKALVTQTVSETYKVAAAVSGEMLEKWITVGGAGSSKQVFLFSEFIDSDPRVSVTESLFPNLFQALRLLHKATFLVAKFKVAPEQLHWLSRYADEVGWLDVNALQVGDSQVVPAGDCREQFESWGRLVDLFRLRDALRDGADTLTELFSLTRGSVTAADALRWLSDHLTWSLLDLQFLCDKERFGFDSVSSFRDERALKRLWDCFELLKRVGAPADKVWGWSGAGPGDSPLTPELAEAAWQTVKARYGEQWTDAVKPSSDLLRERRSSALCAYLLSHSPVGGDGQPIWRKVDDLYAHFLIDVEMSSAVATSRIKQACASVQLFVQRCLMNLEAEVVADSAQDERWLQWDAWMKTYRVWEANRKVFLYPENWIEPDLRDDKSPFFVELENELLQGEIDKDSTEQALRHYLEKLAKVARLEICGLCRQDTATDPDIQDILHVFGRTPETPHSYYYRQRIHYRQGTASYDWTPWAKADLDIEGDHLLPVVWNERLFMFWLLFKQETKQRPLELKTTGTTEEPPQVWKIQVAWSEFESGAWSGKKISKECIEVGGTWEPPGLENEYPQEPTHRCSPLTAYRPFTRCYSCTKGNIKGKQYLFCDGSWLPRKDTFLMRAELDPTTGILNLKVHWPYPDSPWPFLVLSKQFTFVSRSQAPEVTAVAQGRALTTSQFLIPSSMALVVKEELAYGVLDEIHPEKSATPLVNPTFCQEELPAHPRIIWVNTHSGARPASYSVVPIEWSFEDDADDLAVMDNRRTFMVSCRHLYTRKYCFYTLYHPYTAHYFSALDQGGIPLLLSRALQRDPGSVLPDGHPLKQPQFNFSQYAPDTTVVVPPFPEEKIAFDYDSYALYNWELFFHIPLLIADRLSKNQRFADAVKWFHYIFNPTDTTLDSTSADQPQQHYWQTKPFFEREMQGTGGYLEQEIEQLLRLLAEGGHSDLITAVEKWRRDPFKPHLVARTRSTAFQKTVVMKYIENLISWGDQLFRGETIETFNEATQLYVLAAEILGRRPELIKSRRETPIQTYNAIRDKMTSGDFSDPLVAAENLVGTSGGSGSSGAGGAGTLQLPTLLYFAVPKNEKLWSYWDVVNDRLFKIRHGLNIEGVAITLPLYEPPIDPGLLVRAAAAGVSLSGVLSDMNAPLPYYRFNVMAQKATELCAEVKALGGALLSALEKHDAEGLALLRSSHEISVLQAVRDVKKQQVEESKQTLAGLKQSLEVVNAKYNFYKNIPYTIQEEEVHLSLLDDSIKKQELGSASDTLANVLSVIPQLKIGAPTSAGTEFGGQHLYNGLKALSSYLSSQAAINNSKGSMSATKGGYVRRWNEWKLQESLAEKESRQIEKQIAAAEIRLAIAEKELENHDLQIDNAKEVDELMRNKFTNQQLYDWMVGQVSTMYFQGYQLAYDVAKRAERCYRYELGLSDSNFIQFGYWDSLKKGLLAGERLHHDLKRMEVSYLDKNQRELEISKHVSLAVLDPLAILSLKVYGQCEVELPEQLFDLDHPGHYMRRLKAVSLTIPCVAGPYTSVNCTLTLLRSDVRTTAALPDNSDDNYPRRPDTDDPRFSSAFGKVQSIVTSSGQNDSGVFELNFREERYLPFEGSGVISRWRIELPYDFRQFDYDTISDVVLHLRYTARDGGNLLKQGARKAVQSAISEAGEFPQTRLFSLRHDFPTQWSQFHASRKPETTHAQMFSIPKGRFPFMFQRNTITVVGLNVLGAQGANSRILQGLTVKAPDGADVAMTDGIPFGALSLLANKGSLEVEVGNTGDWTLCIPGETAAGLSDIYLVLTYLVV